MVMADYPGSWYAATATGLAERPSLGGDLEADVCVIGGGFTGLANGSRSWAPGRRAWPRP